MAVSARLGELADELYSHVPEQFTAARDAAVREARSRGDRELATRLSRLRRPSVSAWLANCLVRSETDLTSLYELGADLREAQNTFDGKQLQQRAQERHRLIRSLLDAAASLAAEQGRTVPEPTLRELEHTLDAVLADQAAEQAFRTGRLLRSLASSGMEAVDLADAVAGEHFAANQATAPKRSASGSAPATPTKDRITGKKSAAKKATPPQSTAPQPTATQRTATQRAVRDAHAAVKSAENQLAEAEGRAEHAQADLAEASRETAELTDALQAAHQREKAAARRARSSQHAASAAARDRDAARRALARVTTKANPPD